jgi:hypothetical protein
MLSFEAEAVERKDVVVAVGIKEPKFPKGLLQLTLNVGGVGSLEKR